MGWFTLTPRPEDVSKRRLGLPRIVEEIVSLMDSPQLVTCDHMSSSSMFNGKVRDIWAPRLNRRPITESQQPMVSSWSSPLASVFSCSFFFIDFSFLGFNKMILVHHILFMFSYWFNSIRLVSCYSSLLMYWIVLFFKI